MAKVPYYVREIRKGQEAAETENLAKSPRIMIAGVGKKGIGDLVSLALLRIWQEDGLKPIAYAAGPSYDFHHALRIASGHPSYSLDAWFHDEDSLFYLLTHYAESSRIALIHSRMPYFDTYSPLEVSWSEDQSVPPGSPADLARKSRTPVILVVDVREFSFTHLSYLKGLLDFRPGEVVAGFILAGMEEPIPKDIRRQVETELQLPILGTIPPFLLEEDILSRAGILPDIYEENLQRQIDVLRQELKNRLDIRQILRIADQAPSLDEDLPQKIFRAQQLLGFENRRYRLGVAYDEAFSYYYKENLDILQEMGAELVFFSPLKDPILPNNLDGLYFGSGRLLDYLAEASENVSMRQHIYRLAKQGVPVLAEGTASLYLAMAYRTDTGLEWPLVGLISTVATRNPNPHPPYYASMAARRDDLLASQGTSIPCVLEDLIAFEPGGASYRTNVMGLGYEMEGFSTSTIWSSQAYIHFYSEPLLAAKFTKVCKDVMARRLADQNRPLETW